MFLFSHCVFWLINDWLMILIFSPAQLFRHVSQQLMKTEYKTTFNLICMQHHGMWVVVTVAAATVASILPFCLCPLLNCLTCAVSYFSDRLSAAAALLSIQPSVSYCLDLPVFLPPHSAFCLVKRIFVYLFCISYTISCLLPGSTHPLSEFLHPQTQSCLHQ